MLRTRFIFRFWTAAIWKNSCSEQVLKTDKISITRNGEIRHGIFRRRDQKVRIWPDAPAAERRRDRRGTGQGNDRLIYGGRIYIFWHGLGLCGKRGCHPPGAGGALSTGQLSACHKECGLDRLQDKGGSVCTVWHLTGADGSRIFWFLSAP